MLSPLSSLSPVSSRPRGLTLGLKSARAHMLPSHSSSSMSTRRAVYSSRLSRPWHHALVHLLLVVVGATLFKKSPRLRRYKSDRHEFWQECSSRWRPRRPPAARCSIFRHCMFMQGSLRPLATRLKACNFFQKRGNC